MEKEAKILIVDDKANVLEVIRDILEEEDYRCMAVSSGEDAIRAMEKEHFDILLTDIVMPGMDGTELIRKARQISPDIVPIMITGYPNSEGIQQAYFDKDLYVHDYIIKPVKRDELCASVAEALEKKAK